jgi:hypothetical protein
VVAHVEAVLEAHFILTARQMAVLAVRDIGVVIADTIAAPLAVAAWVALAETYQMKDKPPTGAAGSIFMGPCTLPVAAVVHLPMVQVLEEMVEVAVVHLVLLLVMLVEQILAVVVAVGLAAEPLVEQEVLVE